MKRKFRLTRSNDIKRVRRFGKSYAHPLVVLVVERGSPETTRIGVITGKAVGGAVQRNTARRRIKAICQEILPRLTPGFQAILIGRTPTEKAAFNDLQKAIENVFQRAGLINKSDEQRT